MLSIENLFSSDSSESDEDGSERQNSAHSEPVGFQQLPINSKPLETDDAKDVNIKYEDRENVPICEQDTKDVKWEVSKPFKRKMSALEAMEKERYLLWNSGQEELSDLFYKKRDLIKKHVEGADEIVFNHDEGIENLKSFIEERFCMQFGPTEENPHRELSAEEIEEQKFLIDHSLFITKVILRMNHLEPDDYKDKMQNFHSIAKTELLFRESELRSKELEEMYKMFDRFRAREEYLARVRDGEESSDGDDFDDSDDDDDDDNDDDDDDDDDVERDTSATKECEDELVTQMKKLNLHINSTQVDGCIRGMLANLHLRPSIPPRVRCSSPPREEIRKDDFSADVPWANDEESCNERLNTVTDKGFLQKIDNEKRAPVEIIESHNLCLFDWSEDIFPDEEAKSLDRIRPLDIFDDFDFEPKRKAVKDGCDVRKKPREHLTIRLRPCMKSQQQELLTDIDETVLTVEERLFWRERFESQSCKKKSVRFREFDDPENKCRFFTRPTDVEGMGHPSLEQNPLRDACPQAHYVDCTLVAGHHIIRKYMTRSAPVFASFSHDPDRYVKKLRNREDGMNYVMLYTSLHPPRFLATDVRESCFENGLHLPALPGKASPVIPNLTSELRAYILSCFRRDMHSNRQNRSGISIPRHMDPPVLVAGILFLSDSLLQAVNAKKLSNALLERFHPIQGVEDMIAVIDRCSYEELEIRHCVLAWGHDLIVYFRNDPVTAAGRAICVLLHLRKAFERRRLFFEQQGYRRRNAPQFWLITIPEVGFFAQHFKIFNTTIRSLFANHEHFQMLDWAAEMELDRFAHDLKNRFTKDAVERRFYQLFELCRHKLDLTFFRYMEEKMKERRISWYKQDYLGV